MVDQGVVVVVAAGNAGEDGPFEASNGASGKHVVSVVRASFDLFSALSLALGSGTRVPCACLTGNKFQSYSTDIC